VADLNGDDDKKNRSRKSPSDFGSVQASAIADWEKEHLIGDLKKDQSNAVSPALRSQWAKSPKNSL